jgi:hypothetical protein
MKQKTSNIQMVETGYDDERGSLGNKREPLPQWRRILVVAGTAFVLLVVITPAILFAIGDATDDSRADCWQNSHRVSDSLPDHEDSRACTSEGSYLTASVCASHVSHHWNSTMPGLGDRSADGRVISRTENAMCNLSVTEKELEQVFSYKPLASSACASDFSTLLCRYFFKLCFESGESPWQTVTPEECLSLQQRNCSTEWQLIQQYLSLLNSCLTLPNCTRLIITEANSTNISTVSPEERLSGTSSLLASTEDTISQRTSNYRYNMNSTDQPTVTNEVNNTLKICNGLLETGPELSNISCRIPCPADDMVVETSYITAYLSVSYICISIEYICSFIIFYTWARARQLLKFPHITILIVAVLNFLRVIFRSLPFMIGRSQLMCPSKEQMIYNITHTGSEFCKIQGGIVHFLSMSTGFLFCFTIFNVLVAIITFRRNSFFKRHQMATCGLEMIVVCVIAGSTVGGVYAKCSYSTDPFFAGLCLPSGYRTMFYTMILPTEIVTLSTMVMVGLISRRIRQSSSLRESIGAADTKTNIAQLALSRRFKVLSVAMQLSLSIIFTSYLVHDTIYDVETIKTGVIKFWRCKMLEEPQGKTCVSSPAVQGLIVVLMIVQSIFFAATSVIMVMYCTIPVPAREVWAKHADQVRKMLRRIHCRSHTDM